MLKKKKIDGRKLFTHPMYWYWNFNIQFCEKITFAVFTWENFWFTELSKMLVKKLAQNLHALNLQKTVVLETLWTSCEENLLAGDDSMDETQTFCDDESANVGGLEGPVDVASRWPMNPGLVSGDNRRRSYVSVDLCRTDPDKRKIYQRIVNGGWNLLYLRDSRGSRCLGRELLTLWLIARWCLPRREQGTGSSCTEGESFLADVPYGDAETRRSPRYPRFRSWNNDRDARYLFAFYNWCSLDVSRCVD